MFLVIKFLDCLEEGQWGINEAYVLKGCFSSRKQAEAVKTAECEIKEVNVDYIYPEGEEPVLGGCMYFD